MLSKNNQKPTCSVLTVSYLLIVYLNFIRVLYNMVNITVTKLYCKLLDNFT